MDNDEERERHADLFLAIRTEDVETVRQLLNHVKTDIIDKNNKDNTPLHYAVERGKRAIVETLLQPKWNTNIDATNDRGDTPLHIASLKGNAELVRLLLSEGANIDVENYEGEKPLDLAREPEVIRIFHGHERASLSNHASKEFETATKDKVSKGETSYEKRVGTTSIRGQLYKINMAMLFLLHGITNKENDSIEGFHMATNMKEANEFGDIVFKWQHKDRCGKMKSNIIFMLTKHKENVEDEITSEILFPKTNKKSEFSLKDYFACYLKIRDQFGNEKRDHPIFGNEFDDSEFIVFTNASISSNIDTYEQLFSTNDVEARSIFDFDGNNHYHRLSLGGNKDEEISSMLQGSVDDVNDFFCKFKLFVGQPNESGVSEIIKRRLQLIYRVKPNDINGVFSATEHKVRSWWTDGDEYLTESNRFFQQSLRVSIKFDVKNPVKLFTGRIRQLGELHRAIQRNQGHSRCTVVSQTTSVSGLGGIGKTEFAREYIRSYGDFYDGNVIWINAESEQTLDDSFRRLAGNELNISTKNVDGRDKEISSIVAETYLYFSKRKSIFVFDNVDDTENFDMYLPLRDIPPDRSKPHILITSRTNEWEVGVHVLKLEELTLKEAVEFVKKGLKISGADKAHDENIERLVETLQRFPLAIQQAISYIKDQTETNDLKINVYLESFEKKKQELLDWRSLREISDDYGQTTYTTWKITTDKISETRVGKIALRILQAIAYLASENIPRDIFLNLADGNDQDLRAAVRLLVKFSMINGEKRQSELSIHRLVQQVTRLEREEKREEKQTIDEAFRLLKENFAVTNKLDTLSKNNRLMPHMEAIVSHLDEWVLRNPEAEREIERDYMVPLLQNLSRGYFDSGNATKMKEILERGVAIKEKHFGSDHFEITGMLTNLGTSYGQLGDPLTQKKILERSLKIQEKHYGGYHVEMANTLVSLGIACGLLGDPLKQKDLIERALKLQEEHQDCDRSTLASTLSNLGNAYSMLGDHQKQKEILERALNIEEAYYGPDHISVSTTLVNLGSAYGHLGDYQKKKHLLERALELKEKHYGSDHYEVGGTLVNLGIAYGLLHDDKMQRDILERALEIQEKHYGSDNFNLSIVLQNLGRAYGRLGNLHKKKEYIERALKIEDRHYGPDHVAVSSTMVSLGNTYGELGDLHRQKELIQHALQVYEKYYGDDHIKLVHTLDSLAKAYSQLGEPQKMKELLERRLKIQEKYHGCEHITVVGTLLNLGNAHCQLGHPAIQRDLVERALNIKEKHHGSDHIDIVSTLLTLAKTYAYSGDPHKQKEVLERALKIQETHYSSHDFRISRTLANLGEAHYMLGNYQTHKELIQRALKLAEAHYGHHDIKLCPTIKKLSKAYSGFADYQRQKDLLERVLKIKEQYYGSNHPEVANALVNLSSANACLGNHQKQKELLERALEMQENFYQADNIIKSITLDNLADAYGHLGDGEKKKELLERALEIQEKHYGTDHFALASTLLNLASAHGQLGNFQTQKDLAERALNVREKHYGSDHFRLVSVLIKLGTSCGELGDLPMEKELIERAWKIEQNHYGSDNLQASTLLKLAESYEKLGDLHTRIKLLEQALEIQRKHFGNRHVEVARTLARLGECYGKTGNTEKMKELLEEALPIMEQTYNHDHPSVIRILEQLATIVQA